MRTNVRTPAAAALLLGLSLLASASAPATATTLTSTADAPSDQVLTWSVRPTPTKADPERPNFSFGVHEGATVTDSIRVRNFGTDKLFLKIYASDALTTASGGMDLLPASETPNDVGAWTVLEKSSIEVEPAEYVDVPFTMKVPLGVESGDHAGGIVTSSASDGTSADGRPVILDRRLGSRIQVRVDGELRPALTISDVKTRYAAPAGLGGSVTATYTVKNTGNVRLAADQDITVKGLFGLGERSPVQQRMPELLPGNSLTLTANVSGVKPMVHSTTAIRLRPVATRDGDRFPGNTASPSASTSLWTIPWLLLGLLVLLGGGLTTRRQQRSRRTAREERLVRDALAARTAGGSRG